MSADDSAATAPAESRGQDGYSHGSPHRRSRQFYLGATLARSQRPGVIQNPSATLAALASLRPCGLWVEEQPAEGCEAMCPLGGAEAASLKTEREATL